MKVIFNYLFHLLVIFGFLFEIPLVGPLTTRRISCFIAIISLLFKRKELKKLFATLDIRKFKKSVANFIICMLLTLICSIGVEQNYMSSYLEPWYFFNLLLYVPLFAIYSVLEFRSVKEYLYVYIGCFLIQTIVVYYATIDSSFRLLIYELFYSGDNRFERYIENGTRVMGIALHSSTGSIICSTSIVLLTFCYIKKYINNIAFWVLSVLFISMTLFIGRAGMLVELICLVYAIIFGKNGNKIVIITLASIGAFIVGFIILSLLSSSDSNAGDYLVEWMTDAFTSEGRQETLNNINRTLPPISLEFIFGTTVMTGRTPSGTTFDSDSGFVMMYSSLGIIGSILYYMANLNLYKVARIYNNNVEIYRYFLLLIILSFAIEYKEPFMLKYVFSYMIVVLALFSAKESINSFKS